MRIITGKQTIPKTEKKNYNIKIKKIGMIVFVNRMNVFYKGLKLKFYVNQKKYFNVIP